MIRWLLRFVGACLIWAVCCLPALTQEKPPLAKLKPDIPPGGTAPEVEGRGPPVAEFVVAILITALILTVVCMPSRKLYN